MTVRDVGKCQVAAIKRSSSDSPATAHGGNLPVGVCTHPCSVVQVLDLASGPHHIAQRLHAAAGDAHTQLGLPAELTQPASDIKTCTAHVAQLMSDIAAVQLPLQQLEAEPEAHEPWRDCQGLQLLSNDRPLNWEAFVRQQLVPAAGGNTVTACKFLDDAALADCKAYGLTQGTVPDPDYPLTRCCCMSVFAQGNQLLCLPCSNLDVYTTHSACCHSGGIPDPPYTVISSSAAKDCRISEQGESCCSTPSLLSGQKDDCFCCWTSLLSGRQANNHTLAWSLQGVRRSHVPQTASCTASATWLRASCFGCGRTTCRGFMKPTWL